MPSDLLTLHLGTLVPQTQLVEATIQPVHSGLTEDLAATYFQAYPPGVACSTLNEARQEIRDTFADEYGVLRSDGSAVAISDGRVAGAIFVVEKSIWDADLDGPFIIDLFVDPAIQGTGIGRALILHAAHQCAIAGDEQISLRVGDGTSPSAHALYKKLGFLEM